MREETVRTGGKINLYLFITGRRENGYHELDTLFVRLPEPQDMLVFRPAERESGIRVSCDTTLASLSLPWLKMSLYCQGLKKGKT